MGKKSAERDAQAERDRARAEAAADKAKAEEARAALRARIGARRKAIDAKDWDNAPDFVGHKSIAAEKNRQMENSANLTSTGIAGLADKYANPDQVKMASQLLKDRQGQVQGAQFESDINDYIGSTEGMEQDDTNATQGLYTSFYDSAQQRAWQNQQLYAQIAMQRASVLPQMIGAGLGGLGTIFGGFGVGNFGKKT